MAKDIMRSIVAKRGAGISCGIPSYCTANELVIEACLQQAKRFDDSVLIEATANQVNQFGGYTGMKPADFRDFVRGIAERIDFPWENVILGGDHLGPLTWTDECEAAAMEKSRELVRAYVLAGFQKIHLDTSMRLADDPTDQRLSDETVARRGAILYQACEQAWQELAKEDPARMHPVFIIGSEVPIPGGAQEAEDHISVTKPEDLERTVETYRRVFREFGLEDAFRNIIGIVVQPGVEFGDDDVFVFDRVAADALVKKAAELDGMVLEGHSTDYQPPHALKEMVNSGVAILKVGPALTFALREGLYALSMMERELVPEARQAHFIEKLEQAMLDDPGNWRKHYHGTEQELHLKRKYSYSDRCRYYLARPDIQTAMAELLANMNAVKIPMGMLHQYLPIQYLQVRSGALRPTAENLVKSCVAAVADDYNYAVKKNYFVASALE